MGVWAIHRSTSGPAHQSARMTYPSPMPRKAHASVADLGDHVLNRGNARAAVFHKDGDSR
jgi:hypothetical protein